jgi:DNA-binding MarR family transcriptional regulator
VEDTKMAKGVNDTGLYEVDLKEIDARVFLKFVQAGEAVLKYADAVLVRADLSLVKLMALQLLEVHGGTLTPSAIARLTLREKHNITTLIRRLRRDGLITMDPSETDKRSIRVTITDKGRKAVAAATPASNIIP